MTNCTTKSITLEAQFNCTIVCKGVVSNQKEGVMALFFIPFAARKHRKYSGVCYISGFATGSPPEEGVGSHGRTDIAFFSFWSMSIEKQVHASTLIVANKVFCVHISLSQSSFSLDIFCTFLPKRQVISN
jgi:hypothetical protein